MDLRPHPHLLADVAVVVAFASDASFEADVEETVVQIDLVLEAVTGAHSRVLWAVTYDQGLEDLRLVF